MKIDREPLSLGIEEEIAEGSTHTPILLFEQRDPKHKYYAKPLFTFSECSSHIGIYRKNHIPSWILGRLFDERVAKISHYSWINGTHTDVIIYGEQPVTEEELKWAAIHGLKTLDRKLESEIKRYRQILDQSQDRER